MSTTKTGIPASANNRPIGVFDSGLGGLTVLREIHRLLPDEDLVYFGDNGRTPYGTKSRETVLRYTLEDVNFLLSKNVKAIVIACNTASACSLDLVRRTYALPVIEVIEPGSIAAVSASRTGRIGVIGTPATIGSEVYKRALEHAAAEAGKPDVAYFGQACPLFVALAEEGWWDGEITRLTAEKYLAPLKAADIDTLVLGCTHYPLLAPVIADVMGSGVTLINSATVVAEALKARLTAEHLLRKAVNKKAAGKTAANSDAAGENAAANNAAGNDAANKNAAPAASRGELRFYTSDSVDKFRQLGGQFLGAAINSVEKAEIGSY